MENKYKEIGNLLRKSLDVDHCYDCPFNKMCTEIHKREKNEWFLCDAVRIMAIEKKLKEFDENT